MFEVLSQNTGWLDMGEKFDDYDATPAIRHHVLVYQDRVRVDVYSRNELGRLDRNGPVVLRDLGDRVAIPGLEIVLPLSGIYERVNFG